MSGGFQRPVAALSSESVARLRAQLLSSVRRCCPPWLSAHAEDIVQKSLIRLVAHQERSGGDPEPSASYLKRAAYNGVVDEVRRHFKHREVPESEHSALDDAPARTADPERQAGSREIHAAIRECLARLLRSQRVAVACRLHGLTVPETARFVGWSRKKVEHLVRRGLDGMRGCLAEKGLAP